MAHTPPRAAAGTAPSTTATPRAADSDLLGSAAPVGIGDATAHLPMGGQPSTLDQALAAKPARGGRAAKSGGPIV